MADCLTIKNIKKMEYTLPNKSGVYLLTGVNGTGKTTLLTALNRLGDNNAFSRNFNNEQQKDASVTYKIGETEVSYKKKKKRWVPTPRSHSKLIKNYKYHNTYFLTTTGLRMYQQENINLARNKNHVEVEKEIKDALNEIFSTQRFNNLQCINVKPKKGRQKSLHRDNKLYVIKNSSSNLYSELSFSLGERMVLNAIDFIAGIESGAMLLIDEVELALHPHAQYKFYKYLEEKSETKDLVIIISTHSTTLIKKAKNIHYLEDKNKDGNIEIIDNVKSAYILRDLSIEEDISPDYIFLVEDDMAKIYFTSLWGTLKSKEREMDKIIIKILPVGGYSQVLHLMTYFYTVPPFSNKNVYSFLDKDVESTYNNLKEKEGKTQGECDFINLMDKEKKNYKFLPITPELDIWEELTKNSKWFEEDLKQNSEMSFKLEDIIREIDTEEKTENERKRAKRCFDKLFKKIETKLNIKENEIRNRLMKSYVKYRYTTEDHLSEIKKLILPILKLKHSR